MLMNRTPKTPHARLAVEPGGPTRGSRAWDPGRGPSIRNASEVELRAEFQERPADDLVRLQPCGPRAAVHVEPRQRNIGVGDIVDVEVRSEPRVAEPELPREPQVQLVDARVEDRPRRDDIDGDRGIRSRRKVPAE